MEEQMERKSGRDFGCSVCSGKPLITKVFGAFLICSIFLERNQK
ncbi:hypothetical protein [Virgibacillus senegalensis]|nr:hypothetical protein [Virgibacillus senegalensis]